MEINSLTIFSTIIVLIIIGPLPALCFFPIISGLFLCILTACVCPTAFRQSLLTPFTVLLAVISSYQIETRHPFSGWRDNQHSNTNRCREYLSQCSIPLYPYRHTWHGVCGVFPQKGIGYCKPRSRQRSVPTVRLGTPMLRAVSTSASSINSTSATAPKLFFSL